MQIFAPLTSEQEPSIQKIEIASSFQLPGFHIVGLPSPEVAEAKERIRAALESSGFELPKRRIVFNLSPASVKKRGTGLDLAMALSVLSLRLPSLQNELDIAAWGELGLDGWIKPAGQPTRVLVSAWDAKIKYLFICPEELPGILQSRKWIENSKRFSQPPPVLICVKSLEEASIALNRIISEPNHVFQTLKSEARPPEVSLKKEVKLLKLSPSLERIIGVAASGRHHLILLGAKGAGKSYALEWLIRLQPECQDSVRVHRALLAELARPHARSETEIETDTSLVRRVSSSVRPSALTGTSTSQGLRPGEFSLAHGGLLIADEFPEWARDSREALREPMERGRVTLTRSKASLEFPAQFVLAANGNLCSCGGWPPEHPIPFENFEKGTVPRKIPRCRCSIRIRNDYKARLSGPILDRMDLVLFVVPPQFRSSRGTSPNHFEQDKSLSSMQERVGRCRERLLRRWAQIPGLLSAVETEALIGSHPQWDQALENISMSTLRARHKIVRVALSLAAWDDVDEPGVGHFIEAASYRPERFGLCD
jgi:magnesium chelatase family protein